MAVVASVDVEVEHGCFALISGDDDRPELIELFATFDDRLGISDVGGGLLVASPTMFSSAVLSVHVLDDQPSLDPDWPEVFEAGLDIVGGGGLHYHSLGAVPVDLAVPDGRYDVRICGGGFVDFESGDLDGDDEVVWRVQLWPRASDEAAVPRRVRKWAGPEYEPPVVDKSLPAAWQDIQRQYFAVRAQRHGPWLTRDDVRAARRHVGLLAEQGDGAIDMVLTSLGGILAAPLRKPDSELFAKLSAWAPQLETLVEYLSPPAREHVAELITVARACLAELGNRGEVAP